MFPKSMSISFSAEDKEIYNLIKAKKYSSRFVISCVRYYLESKKKTKEGIPHQPLSTNISSQPLIDEDYIRSLVRQSIEEILKEKDIQLTPRQDSQEEETSQEALTSLLNKEIIAGAADMFDDDD